MSSSDVTFFSTTIWRLEERNTLRYIVENWSEYLTRAQVYQALVQLGGPNSPNYRFNHRSTDLYDGNDEWMSEYEPMSEVDPRFPENRNPNYNQCKFEARSHRLKEQRADVFIAALSPYENLGFPILNFGFEENGMEHNPQLELVG
ncbi:hypothetical protein G7Y79_00046g082220 [Physcia stellaris]|nr:hypothetical protein G7Y79_00046g082220 [Physcia stellaris]